MVENAATLSENKTKTLTGCNTTCDRNNSVSYSDTHGSIP